jgi:hypothetical protein
MLDVVTIIRSQSKGRVEMFRASNQAFVNVYHIQHMVLIICHPHAQHMVNIKWEIIKGKIHYIECVIIRFFLICTKVSKTKGFPKYKKKL